MQRFLFVFAIMLCSRGILLAQDQEPTVSTSNKFPITVGTELDALPYISGGYYGSIWLGYDRWRVRGIVTQTFPPDFMTPEYFTDYEINVVAIIIDYFVDENGYNLEGFWFGTGVEFWNSQAMNENDSVIGSFKNTIFTFGGGYVWKFYRNFYLNPWFAGHLIVAGDTQNTIGNEVFKSSRFTPEVSLKLGWHF